MEKVDSMVNPVINSMFWRMIEDGVEQTSAEWIKAWIKGEKNLIEDFLNIEGEGRVSKGDLVRWRDQILEMLDSVTVEEMRKHCMKAKPELEETWKKEETIKAFKRSLENAKKFIKEL